MDPDLTLQRLEYFTAAARTRSFRKAASQFGITQPAISAHVKALEKRLGVDLFERGRRGVAPTSLGEQLLERAAELIAAADRFLEYSTNLREGTEGVVSVGAYPVHLERFLARVAGEFRALYPRIRIDLTKLRDDRRRGAGRSLVDELLARDVDLAMGPPHPEYDLDGVKAFDARILALVPDDHPYRHRLEIPVVELMDQPLLIAPPLFFSRTTVEAAARQADFELTVIAESSSPPALVALGRAGLGWPVLPDDYSVVRSAKPYPVVVDVRGVELATPVLLQWRRSEALSPAADRFVKVATKWAKKERKAPLCAAM